VLLFDARVGGTHLVNATAAELLGLVQSLPGLTSTQIQARLIEALGLAATDLPVTAVEDVLERFAALDIVAIVAA